MAEDEIAPPFIRFNRQGGFKRVPVSTQDNRLAEKAYMMVGKEHAADRLMQSQKLRRGSPYLMGSEPPTPAQVAAILHALADHTLIENMLHSAPELGTDRAHLGESWALTTGLGRYFQRMGDWLEGLSAPPGEGSQ